MDVERRDGFQVGGDGPSAADTHSDWAHVVMVASAGKLRQEQIVELAEQRVGGQVVIDLDPVAIDQFALQRDQANTDLRATDIDGHHHVGGRRRARGHVWLVDDLRRVE